jgi:hypothetical protein
MAQTKPAIIGTAVTAWEDAFRAIGAMPLVAGTAFAIVILMALASFWIISDPYALAASHWLPVYSIVSGIIQGLLLAPLAIAVHRYVLLGEAMRRYPLDPFSARYVRFVGFAVLVKILWSLPSIVQSFMRDAPEDTGAEALLGLVELALFITVLIVTVRRVILFPAIAVDAPGATWSNARRDTKGSSWRVAFILVCVAVPGTILGGLLYWALFSGGLGGANQLFFSLLGAIVEIPMLCAFAAAASHIFRSRADTLAQPAG